MTCLYIKSIPDQAKPSNTEYQIHIRGPDIRPAQALSSDVVHSDHERAAEPGPNQATSSDILPRLRERAVEPKLDGVMPSRTLHGTTQRLFMRILDDDVRDDTWDVIIVCSILGELLGRAFSRNEISLYINYRDERIEDPFGPYDIEHSLEMAKLPEIQERYPKKCEYKQWAAVKTKYEKGIRDDDDVYMIMAYKLHQEMSRTLDYIESGHIKWPPAAQQNSIATVQQGGRSPVPPEGRLRLMGALRYSPSPSEGSLSEEDEP